MSAIASFILIPKSALSGLRAAATPQKRWFRGPRDTFPDFLQSNGRVAATYDFSGYVLATLLPHLDERGIALMTSEHSDLAAHLSTARQCTCFILTAQHRNAFLARLTPSSYLESELRDYYNDFNATSEPQIGDAMLEGIRALHESLGQVDDSSVLLLLIG